MRRKKMTKAQEAKLDRLRQRERAALTTVFDTCGLEDPRISDALVAAPDDVRHHYHAARYSRRTYESTLVAAGYATTDEDGRFIPY